jgi:hypothetical protein
MFYYWLVTKLYAVMYIIKTRELIPNDRKDGIQ